MNLMLDRVAVGYEPPDLYESPFLELEATPPFPDIVTVPRQQPYEGSLDAFAGDLIAVLRRILAANEGPVHVAISGGYDSRILLYLLEEAGREPLCVSDGTQEPQCSETLDYLAVPESRRYFHDLTRPDPYGVVDAVCDGYAPLYVQLRFFPEPGDATLVTGLGGGEWTSYQASGWHNGKRPRAGRDDVVGKWLDCWPQHTLIHKAWERGYKHSVHPYCTVQYASVMGACRTEWLIETDPANAIDAVREAVMDNLDPGLKTIGWAPHRYDFKLTAFERAKVDGRIADTWLWNQLPDLIVGRPSDMTDDERACTLAGLATWCDLIRATGEQIHIQ